MAKGRKFKGFSAPSKSTARRAMLEETMAHARSLLENDEAEQALTILLPLADEFSNDAELRSMLGVCFMRLDAPDAAAEQLEKAYALAKRPSLLLPLGLAYYQMAMSGSALHALEELERSGLPLPDDAADVLEELRQEVRSLADEIGLRVDKALGGLREMERGLRWLARSDPQRAIQDIRAAIRTLGDWPTVHNHLAMALFMTGQAAPAIAEVKAVLARQPQNLTAACHLVRFLAWSGEREAAAEAWQPLRTRAVANLPLDALLLGEIAAVMDDDKSVRHFFGPLDKWNEEDLGGWHVHEHVQEFLATADANLGDVKEAKRRLRALGDLDPNVQMVSKALRQGKRGLGLVDRFPYYFSADVVPPAVSEEFAQLADEFDAAVGTKALRRLAAQYPQCIVMTEKLLWEEGQVELALLLLQYMATPVAHASLRRFAGSQAGSDKDRMAALLSLQMSGGAQPGETLHVWLDGAWHETVLRNYTIDERGEHRSYSTKTRKLMEQGQTALAEGRGAESAALMRQILELEPRACDALNNLAHALDSMGDAEGSRAALEQALAIKPGYLYAAVNLALKVVKEDVAAAEAYLAPLATRTEFTTEEFVFYHYGLARIAFARSDFSAARNFLNMTLTFDPFYAPAVNLLKTIDVQPTTRRPRLGLPAPFARR